MPNSENILRPLVLISPGRSGTSLIAAAFDARGDCFYCGETAELITKIWTGVEFSRENSVIKVDKETPPARHCSIAVRSVFLTLFASEKPIWFHKPIGIPRELMQKIRMIGEYEALDWYWTALTETFPDGQFFTVLRNPYDVALSSKAFWKFDEDLIWNHMRLMANLIMHPKSRIDYAISFDGLTSAFEQEIVRLCSHLKLSSSPEMSLVKKLRLVPSQLSASSEQFGYKSLWNTLGDGPRMEEAINAIDRVWQRFGRQFERRPDRVSLPVSV